MLGIYHCSKFLKSTSELPPNARFGILLNRTNFYAEQGGQENDTGMLVIDGKADFKVEDVQVYNGYVLHIGQMEEGELKVGDDIVATYDEVGPPLIRLSLRLTLSAAKTMAYTKQPHGHSHPKLCAPGDTGRPY